LIRRMQREHDFNDYEKIYGLDNRK
jgi:hypothetical protein